MLPKTILSWAASAVNLTSNYYNKSLQNSMKAVNCQSQSNNVKSLLLPVQVRHASCHVYIWQRLSSFQFESEVACKNNRKLFQAGLRFSYEQTLNLFVLISDPASGFKFRLRLHFRLQWVVPNQRGVACNEKRTKANCTVEIITWSIGFSSNAAPAVSK